MLIDSEGAVVDRKLLEHAMSECGLQFLGLRRSTGIPPYLAGMVTSRHPEEGRRDRTVGLDDPDRVAKANADWYELGTQFGLFSENRRFLLSLPVPVASEGADEPPEAVWGLVELLDAWDVIGRGGEVEITGWAYGCPAFVMSAVDGSVFVQGTMWQDSMGTAILPAPHGVKALRDVARLNVGKSYRTAAENEDTLAWLARGDEVDA
ncbi:hypothetical protein OG336_00680 [[Kitasatospora] papulosa]|uniref:hypothetical protein n=1 Tax=[Kitasatospora] papulosa TaxID=1464011 RepID=UPI002E158F50|nr:hypothetical protein OG336_00680 [[Kitasatospora] papulosa]